MKKIISLLASVAMLASMFTSVSAAEIANNAPAVETTVTELSAEEYENDWIGEVLPENEKAYLVELSVSGLDLSSVRSGKTAVLKKKRDGVLLMYASYKMNFDNLDNVTGVYSIEGFAGSSAAEKTLYAMKNFDDVTQAYPVASNDNDTVATADALENLHTYVVTTKDVVVGTPVAEFKISSFHQSTGTGTQDYTDANGNISYTVNGEDAKEVTFGEADDPIVPDPDPEPKEMEITVSDERFDLDVDGDEVADGYAWEVFVANYDSTKTVSAKFTDAETGATRAGKEKTEITGLAPIAEANGGSVEFVALLQLSQFRNVNMEIVVE